MKRYHPYSEQERKAAGPQALGWDQDVADRRRRGLDPNRPETWDEEREARYQRIYTDDPNPYE